MISEHTLGPLGDALLIGTRLLFLRDPRFGHHDAVFVDLDNVYSREKLRLAPRSHLEKLMAVFGDDPSSTPSSSDSGGGGGRRELAPVVQLHSAALRMGRRAVPMQCLVSPEMTDSSPCLWAV